MFFKKSEFIIVAGSGRFGSAIADSLSLSGFDVTVIDKNEKSFSYLSLKCPPMSRHEFAYDPNSSFH